MDNSSIKTVSRDSAISALSSTESGIDFGSSFVRLPRLKIYQSDKQDKFFSVPPEKKDYGKLFLSTKDVENKIDDLKTSIEATLLRYQPGFTVHQKDGSDFPPIIGSGKGMIGSRPNPLTKDQFQQKHPGYGYTNMVKMVLCLEDSESALQGVGLGLTPFVELELSGSSYGASFTMYQKMSAAIMADKQIQSYQSELGTDNKIPACAYRLTISTEKVTSDAGFDYFTFKIDVNTNSLSEVVGFRPIFDLWATKQLFGNFGSGEETEAETVDTRTVPVDAYTEEETRDEEHFDTDELPF